VQEQQHGAFGQDAFGRGAEKAARFFGTPQYIVGQTIVVIVWIALNALAVMSRWDPYPFILLNLAFSTQAAYAAPLILLAETRQAARDKTAAEMDEKHRDDDVRRAQNRVARLKTETDKIQSLLESNTELTSQTKDLAEQVAGLTREIHAMLAKSS
jgi:uncharacterized membrane protein